ncbi:OxaA precursor, partial [Salmonella sp. gx-f4]|nr:OxaA precursor [Salmonella sp. gx-f4]
MKKKIFLAALLIALITVLSGCTEFNKDITPESKGVWNEYIVYPLSLLIIKVAHLFGNSFGLSIIVVTILIRLVI